VSTTPPDLDARAILALLTTKGVDFVVIGGIAAVLHGSATHTYDLDICFATDAANLAALGSALLEMGATLRGVADDVPFRPDADTLRRIEVLTLSTPYGNFDVLARPTGAPRYETLRRNADRYDVGGFVVSVASLPDLIAMKSAAGRLKDLVAVEELEAIERLRR
jgi:predicted nucleotidyltransferase